MKIANDTNINQILKKIEAILLDFEQFPQTNLLQSIKTELNMLTKLMRKYFQLKEILMLLNEFTIIISAAIEKEIVLKVSDIDLLLHIIDLISDSCNTEYNNISEIVKLSSVISGTYIENCKKISNSISLLKRTHYLKFEDSVFASSFVKSKSVKNIEIKQDKKVSIPIDTAPLTKSIIDNAPEQTNEKIKDNNIDKMNDTAIPKNFDIKEITQLISKLQNSINLASNSTVTLSVEQIQSINKTANLLKNIANDKSIKLFYDTSEQLEVIDNILNTLDDFTNDYSDKPLSNTIQNNVDSNIIASKNVSFKDIYEITSLTITLNNLINYDENFRNTIALLKQSSENINIYANNIIQNFSANHSFDNVNELNKSVNNHNNLLNLFDNLFSEKLLNANLFAQKIYNKLSDLSSKPFSSFTLGLKEYVDAIAGNEHKVALTISGNNVNITADLWQIFDNIIPTLIRHIVVCNFPEVNKTLNKISIDITSNSGIIEMKFVDNGCKNDIDKQIQILNDIIKVAQNAGAKVLLNSNTKGNTYIFRFQMENALFNYFILEASQQFYAVPTEQCELMTVASDNIPAVNLSTLFSNDKCVAKEFIIIKNNSQKLKLHCDKIYENKQLSPLRLTGVLSKLPYSLAATQFGDKSVLILDVAAIFLQSKISVAN